MTGGQTYDEEGWADTTLTTHKKINNLNKSTEKRNAQADSTETATGRDEWDKDSTTYRTVEQYSNAWKFSKGTVWSGDRI